MLPVTRLKIVRQVLLFQSFAHRDTGDDIAGITDYSVPWGPRHPYRLERDALASGIRDVGELH